MILSDQKPHIAVALRILVFGSRFCVRIKPGNLSGSCTKNRRAVADRVSIAFPRVELHPKAAYVALGVGSTPLAGDGREAPETFGLLADLAEHLGLGIASGRRFKLF